MLSKDIAIRLADSIVAKKQLEAERKEYNESWKMRMATINADIDSFCTDAQQMRLEEGADD